VGHVLPVELRAPILMIRRHCRLRVRLHLGTVLL